jgi:hypothetical protein
MLYRAGVAGGSLAWLIVAIAGAACAAPGKTPPDRPAVKGTTQLAGDNGQIGITYTIGKSTPLNITLTDGEYTVCRVNQGDMPIAPLADEKLLVLRYTLQNPNKTVTECDWGSLNFTAVDGSNDNHDAAGVLHAETGQRLSIVLKPAQKVSAMAIFRVPARGEVPKLIVERASGEPVLRYDLRGKVKPLPAPFSAPEDPTGATARTADVPAEMGQSYPLMQFDAKLVSAGYAAGPFGEHEPAEGNRFLVAVFTIKNQGRAKVEYDWGTFRATLRAADGEKTDARCLLKSARNELANAGLDPGEESSMRVVFELPKEMAAKSVSFAEGDSRSYRFDLKP